MQWHYVLVILISKCCTLPSSMMNHETFVIFHFKSYLRTCGSNKLQVSLRFDCQNVEWRLRIELRALHNQLNSFHIAQWVTIVMSTPRCVPQHSFSQWKGLRSMQIAKVRPPALCLNSETTTRWRLSPIIDSCSAILKWRFLHVIKWKALFEDLCDGATSGVIYKHQLKSTEENLTDLNKTLVAERSAMWNFPNFQFEREYMICGFSALSKGLVEPLVRNTYVFLQKQLMWGRHPQRSCDAMHRQV